MCDFKICITVGCGEFIFYLFGFSTSRQSLETIVEAIRHLEGDHLFNDIPSPPGHHKRQVLEEPVQEVPLALTTKHQTPQKLIKVRVTSAKMRLSSPSETLMSFIHVG